MTEAQIQTAIEFTLGGRTDTRLFRNHRGVAWHGLIAEQNGFSVTLAHPRRVETGLAPGGADLIGLKRVVITPDMVGQEVGVFLAIEVKTPKGKRPDDQKNFLEKARQFGGMAGFATSVEEALAIIGEGG
ncbi:MAG: VRR-NUC domain-containing protein [Magnetococcales bacterium]|nr:VRR-NUC domain-containing protein [Magnetococcales bacterium]